MTIGSSRAVWWALAAPFLATAPAAAQQQPPTPPTAPPRVEEQVEVVAVTPIHGLGLSKLKVPANVQVFRADHAGTSTDVATMLVDRAASVQLSVCVSTIPLATR